MKVGFILLNTILMSCIISWGFEDAGFKSGFQKKPTPMVYHAPVNHYHPVHHHVAKPNAHHHIIHHGKSEKRTRWVDMDKVGGCSAGNSSGSGNSIAVAGPMSTKSMSNGSINGVASNHFANERKSASKSFAQMTDGNKKETHIHDNWQNHTKNNNRSYARGEGHARVKAISDTEQSYGKAQGNLAKVKSMYNNETDSHRDKYGMKRNGDDKVTIRNRFANHDKIETKGRAASVGHGQALTNSNRLGSKVIAKGDRFSMGNTNHQAMQNADTDSWKKTKKNGLETSVRERYHIDNKNKGKTRTRAHGKGQLAAFTNRDKGAGAKAEGTCGTENNAGYVRNRRRGADTFANDKKRTVKTIYHKPKPVYHQPEPVCHRPVYHHVPVSYKPEPIYHQYQPLTHHQPTPVYEQPVQYHHHNNPVYEAPTHNNHHHHHTNNNHHHHYRVPLEEESEASCSEEEQPQEHSHSESESRSHSREHSQEEPQGDDSCEEEANQDDVAW